MSEPITTKVAIAKLLREAVIEWRDLPHLRCGADGQPAQEVRFKLGKLPVLKFDNATRNLNICNANATILRFIADAIEMGNP